MRKTLIIILIAVPLLCGAGLLIYKLPAVNERLAWRVEQVQARIKYAIQPPEQVVFVPQDELSQIVQATLQAMTQLAQTQAAQATPTVTPSLPGPTGTPQPSPTPTPTPTPLPASITLKGIVHEYQKWNNCGPATLAMALTYWGWEGDQRDTAPFLKPNPRDKNVMPYEMVDYVTANTGLKALVRSGGDLQTLKRLLAAGFPVVVEKGFVVAKEGWMGHYEVLNGYDDAKKRFIAQDSYIMKDLPVPYAELEDFWEDFNYVYLVIYPPAREAEVMAALGANADEIANYQHAADLASADIARLEGRDLYFAWYNRGTNLVGLGDYAGAAAAYDQAFSVYADLPEDERPWRMVWYQTGPYFAYHFTGRYYDVIQLADTTLVMLSNEPVLEESYVWRARAKAALGDTAGAIEDLNKALEQHPGFPPALGELQLMGAAQ